MDLTNRPVAMGFSRLRARTSETVLSFCFLCIHTMCITIDISELFLKNQKICIIFILQGAEQHSVTGLVNKKYMLKINVCKMFCSLQLLSVNAFRRIMKDAILALLVYSLFSYLTIFQKKSNWTLSLAYDSEGIVINEAVCQHSSIKV